MGAKGLGIYLVFKGQQFEIIERKVFRRPGTEGNYLEVLTLDNGARIVPAHWKYKLVSIPEGVNKLNWLGQLIYSGHVYELVPTTNLLLQKVRPDSNWSADKMLIPIKYERRFF